MKESRELAVVEQPLDERLVEKVLAAVEQPLDERLVEKVLAAVEQPLDERLVEKVLAAGQAVEPGARIVAGVQTVVELAELDPVGTLDALTALRASPAFLRRLEAALDLSPPRATLAVGAALQLARVELSSAVPDLGSRAPELVRWLEGAW